MNHLRKTFKKKKFAIALILLLLVASLFGFIAMGMFGSKYAEVPDLKGKTEKKRKKYCDNLILEIGNISRDYSDDYPENKIIKTKPKQGEKS